MSRLIAIGDIHGCSAALRALLDEVAPAEGDRVVTLGDYVDRGPDSRGVIETLIELSQTVELIPLLGNHEEMMLGAIRGSSPRGWWLQHGGAETLRSYDFKTDLSCLPDEHLRFLDACLPWYEAEEAFFTHANYDPLLPLDQQAASTLRWKSLDEQLPPPHRSGKRAIVGHTAQRNGEVLDADHLWCLDTYCYGGGWLTACDIGTGDLWQADREGRLRVA